VLRAAPFWRARGRSPLPPGGSEAELLARAQESYAQARPLARDVPSVLFPAIGYVALLPGYFRALASGGADTARFSKHAALIVASATGRV
jgi:hypothetical protein